MTDFNSCFERTLGIEGRYVNDPNDPGGETNWGISKRSYPDLNIATLTRDDARRIYERDFWNKINAERLPTSISYQLFDFAINSGCETAIRYFQRALGVADDGHWGPISQAAADKATEPDMIMNLNAERLDYMTRCSAWANDGRGWVRRVAKNLRYGAVDS